jgi:SAM-dependent methyltransferase
VTIDARQGDLADWEPAAESYDGIASIFCHLPPPLRAAVHAKIVRALAPGGVLVIEAFTPRQLEYQKHHTSGGPRSPELLYDAALLRADFAALEVLSLEEHEAMLDEGPLHRGLGFVVSGVLRKR